MFRLALPIMALSVLSACATQTPVNPDQVSIHESVMSAPQRYVIVKRLWIESWSSALMVPTYSSSEDAKADFRRQAASLGGNGVINFGCYSRVISPAPPPGSALSCNATVVRFQ